MDNSAQPNEPAVRHVANRGGIPVEPLQAQSVAPSPVPDPNGKEVSGQSSTPQPSKQELLTEDSTVPNSTAVSTQTVTTPEPAGVQQTGSPKNREHEPAKAAFPDVVKMSETEVKKVEGEVEKEIEAMFEHGKDKEKPDLSPDIKAIGVELAGEDIPMPSYPSGVQPLPMTIDEAEVTRKKYKWKDSISWLSDLIIYHWKKIRIKSKKL